MLTQHELFAFAVLGVMCAYILLLLGGVRGRDLFIGTFYITGVSLTGLLTVLELLFWLVGPLRR